MFLKLILIILISNSTEYILQEIDLLIRTQFQQPNTPINILDSFIREAESLHEILLSSERVKLKTACRIIIFIGIITEILLINFNFTVCILGRNYPSVLVKSCVFLFKNAKSEEHLAFLVHILTNELLDKTREPYVEKGGHFAVVLDQVFGKMFEKTSASNGIIIDTHRMWKNLLTLLQ